MKAELNYANKKSLDSQKKIYKGLRQLLLTKKLEDITVTDISAICDISRTTFYRNFNNVTDVLEVMFNYFYKRYLLNLPSADNKLLFFCNYWQFHKDLVSILYNQTTNVLYNVIGLYFKDSNPELLNLKVEIFCYLLSSWSKNSTWTKNYVESLISKTLTPFAIKLIIE